MIISCVCSGLESLILLNAKLKKMKVLKRFDIIDLNLEMCDIIDLDL